LDLHSVISEVDARRVESSPKAAQHRLIMADTLTSDLSSEDLLSLIGRVAEKGEREAFAALFGYFAPRVKSYLRGMKADEALAEDLAQEVMLTVWRRAGQYDPAQAALSTWIFTIARNKRIDAIRREKRPEIDPNDPALVPDAEPLPEEAVVAQQQGEELRRIIRELPEEQATLLRLSYFEELSHAEIAGQLDLPLGTVKSRLRLAMNKLRVKLEEE
jgi:RNA polymerase sigma-70 factor (ECF subfamily)